MNLVFDRTEADVQKVVSYRAKFEVVDTVGSYIQIQDLGGGKYLVFKGTSSELSEYMAGLKGAWNYTDLNRIGNALRELESSFEAVGIHVHFTAKNNWALCDIPTPTDAENLINDISLAKTNGNVPGEPVSSIDKLNYVTANRIEEIIYIAYTYTQRINGQFNHCGTAICGSEGVIA